jgi:hypothetical protein
MRSAGRRSRSQPAGEVSNQRAPKARQRVVRGECEARRPWKSALEFRALIEANALALVTVSLICSFVLFAQLPRDQWGAMLVTVPHADGKWIIAGQKNKVTSARRSTTARFGFSRFNGFSVNR